MSEETIQNNGQNEDIETSGNIKIVEEKGLGYTITVNREDLFKTASGLKEAGFDLFLFVSGVDYPDSIKLVYRIYSSKRQNKIAVMIKTEVPKSDPVVDSLVPLWSAANWHERETFDLYGVTFAGHPDMRRIFMPEDWIGYPLRKDYSDDRMLVMDDGKKDKPAAAAKADKPAAAPKEKAEVPKAAEAEAPKAAEVEAPIADKAAEPKQEEAKPEASETEKADS